MSKALDIARLLVPIRTYQGGTNNVPAAGNKGAFLIVDSDAVNGTRIIPSFQATFTGALLQSQQELYRTIAASTSSTALDISSSNAFLLTLSSNTSIILSNVPTPVAPSGYSVLTSVVVRITNAAANLSVMWPANIRWPGGVVPPRSLDQNDTDIYNLISYDAGVSWYGSLAIKDAMTSI